MLIAGYFATQTAAERTADKRERVPPLNENISLYLFVLLRLLFLLLYSPPCPIILQPFLLPVIKSLTRELRSRYFFSRLVRTWNLAELWCIEEAVKLYMGLPGLVVEFGVITSAIE